MCNWVCDVTSVTQTSSNGVAYMAMYSDTHNTTASILTMHEHVTSAPKTVLNFILVNDIGINHLE